MISRALMRLSRLVVLTFAALLLFSGICLAANFTASMTTNHSGMNITGKLYVKGANVRQEMTIGGKKQIVICRADKGVTWMVDPKQKMYAEMPGARNERTMHDTLKKMADEKYLGKETINGYSCKKYKYTLHTDKSGTIFQWRSDKLDWPIKTEVKNKNMGVVVEYKNIKEVIPANSLFELPKGYRKKALAAPGSTKMPPMPARKK